MKLIRSTLSSLILASSAAHAATIVVNNSSCTLPSAITAANTDTPVAGCTAGSGPDVIDIRSRVKLSASADDMDLNPPIEGQLTINGHSLEIVKTFGGLGRHFHVSTGADLTLNEVWLRFGDAQFPGGGAILNDAGGKLTINRSTISENDAGVESGGAIVNFGNAIIQNTTIANNDAWIGGGIASMNPSGQPQLVFFNNSTVTGNFGKTNAAFSMEGPVEVRLIHVTMNENKGGVECAGFCGDNRVTLILSNTVMANSQAFPKFPPFIDETDCMNAGPVQALGVNLIEHDDGGCNASSFGFGTDPKLAPLAMNGGPTPTHEPLPQSPLVNVTNCNATSDQRGVSRPQPVGDLCDIGSVERVTLDKILTVFDAKMAKGKLAGIGRTKAIKNQHTVTYRKGLVTSVNFLISKNRTKMCGELKKSIKGLNRSRFIRPAELVTGKGANKLFRTIKSRMAIYHCH